MVKLKPAAGEHYSVSDKEEKVHGYNHSFTCFSCMHISHIHLLVNQVKFVSIHISVIINVLENIIFCVEKANFIPIFAV